MARTATSSVPDPAAFVRATLEESARVKQAAAASLAEPIARAADWIAADPVAILISILFMAATIIVSAGLVLRVRPLPYGPALPIAVVANLLGKLFVSILRWPGAVSYSLPTIAVLGLSHVFFKPSVSKFLLYWISGFALYLVITCSS